MYLLDKMRKVFNKFEEDNVSEYTAECAYFTILSFIPFIIFFSTLIQFTNVDKESLFFWTKQIVPVNMHNLVLSIIDEVYSKSVGTISVAAIFALWSASKGFYYLSKGLRKIYKVEIPRINFFMRIEGIIYTLFFIIAIILFLVLMVFGNNINKLCSEKFQNLSMITGHMLKFRAVILIVAMFFIVLLIYKFIPKHKLKIKTQIYGAAFSSIAWYVTSWGFSIYFRIFNGFSNTYGSLTSIILIMIWVYIGMYIILTGAEINTLIYNYFIKKNCR